MFTKLRPYFFIIFKIGYQIFPLLTTLKKLSDRFCLVSFDFSSFDNKGNRLIDLNEGNINNLHKIARYYLFLLGILFPNLF